MSRNKTIKLLHEVTLKPYAECRAALKRNHWDFVTTYYKMNGGIDLDEFSKVFVNFAENLTQAMAAVCEGLSHCFAGVAESLRHYNATTAAADASRVEAIPTTGLLTSPEVEKVTNKISLEDFEKLGPNEQREILGLDPVEVNDETI